LISRAHHIDGWLALVNIVKIILYALKDIRIERKYFTYMQSFIIYYYNYVTYRVF